MTRLTTTAEVRMLNAQGQTIASRLISSGAPHHAMKIPGDVAARIDSVEITLGTLPDLYGSPGAVAEYERTGFRDLALDQMRRGLDIAGFYDERVARCQAPSPEGAACTLRLYHAGVDVTTGKRSIPGGLEDPHERCASIRTPRQIAEIWTDESTSSLVYCEKHEGQHTEVPSCLHPHYVALKG